MCVSCWLLAVVGFARLGYEEGYCYERHSGEDSIASVVAVALIAISHTLWKLLGV